MIRGYGHKANMLKNVPRTRARRSVQGEDQLGDLRHMVQGKPALRFNLFWFRHRRQNRRFQRLHLLQRLNGHQLHRRDHRRSILWNRGWRWTPNLLRGRWHLALVGPHPHGMAEAHSHRRVPRAERHALTACHSHHHETQTAQHSFSHDIFLERATKIFTVEVPLTRVRRHGYGIMNYLYSIVNILLYLR